MNPIDEVRSRRLTAVLEEALGHGVPEGLGDDIVRRLRTLPARRRSGSATAAAAALLLLGTAVVCGVAGLRHGALAVSTLQDPAKVGEVPIATITTASVRAATPLMQAPAADKAAQRLLEIAKAAEIGIVVSDDVQGQSVVNLDGTTPREAIDRIASERGVGVAEFGDVVLVGDGAKPVPRDRTRVTFHGDLTLRDFVKMLHGKTGANLVLADEVAGRVHCDVVDAPWRSVLDQAASQLGLEVCGCGGVLAIRRQVDIAPPSSSPVDLQDRTLGDAFGFWAKLSGCNVIVTHELNRTASVFAYATSPQSEDLIGAFAATAGADVQVERTVHILVKTIAPETNVTLTAEATTMTDVVQMTASDFTPAVEVAVDIDAKVSVFVDHANALDVLRAAAAATGHHVARAKRNYRIE